MQEWGVSAVHGMAQLREAWRPLMLASSVWLGRERGIRAPTCALNYIL